MNKAGGYGAAFFVCMALCFILGTEFDYEYLYIIEIVFVSVSGVMLYLAIYELYKDMQRRSQAQQNYIEGLKEIVQSIGNSLEIRVAEIGDVCQKHNMNLVNNLESYQQTTVVLMKDLSTENRQTIKEMNAILASAEKTSNLRQEEFIKEIKTIWCKELEHNGDNQKKLAETLKSIEGFMKKECYGLLEKLGSENKVLVECFSDVCKEYIAKLYEESFDSLEKCNNLMDSYIIRQKELIKELQEMHRKLLQHEKKSQELAETTMVFVQNKMTEIQTEGGRFVKEFGEKNRLYVEGLAEKCKTYADELQGACDKSLQKCNGMVDKFGNLCLDLVEENSKNSQEIIDKYGEDLSDSIKNNGKQALETVNRIHSLVDAFTQEIRDMMEKLTEVVSNVNIENSQYVSEIKEYQKELKQLSSEDIKIMEEILNGNK